MLVGGGGWWWVVVVVVVKSFSCKPNRCVDVRLRLGWGLDNDNRFDSFKIYKGLLKNVQKDGTSMCFGGLEINNTKVGTIMWDTLYL